MKKVQNTVEIYSIVKLNYVKQRIQFIKVAILFSELPYFFIKRYKCNGNLIISLFKVTVTFLYPDHAFQVFCYSTVTQQAWIHHDAQTSKITWLMASAHALIETKLKLHFIIITIVRGVAAQEV